MKLNHLESLRGIAALSVAIYHFQVPSLIGGSFFRNSWVMVDFFFVLSGYVISLAYWHRLSTREELISFQLKRFWRVYPLHFVMLLVWLGIELGTYVIKQTPAIQGDLPSFVANNSWTFLMNVLLLQNFTVDTLNWNFPSWSISAEFYTYLVFGALLLVFGQNSWLRRGLMVCVIAGTVLVILKTGLGPTEIGPLRALLGFFIGSLLFEIEGKSAAISAKSYNAFSILWCILLVAFICVFHRMPNGLQAMFPFACALLIYVLNRSTEGALFRRVLNAPALVFLGTISYGIYMIHAAVWWILTLVLSLGFGIRLTLDERAEIFINLQNPYIATGLQIGGLCLILVLATVSYRYLERPLMKPFSAKSR